MMPSMEIILKGSVLGLLLEAILFNCMDLLQLWIFEDLQMVVFGL
jgi:hypothetical protein